MDITLSFYGVHVKSLRANSGNQVWLPYGATVRDAASAYENMKGVKVLRVVGGGGVLDDDEPLFSMKNGVIVLASGADYFNVRVERGAVVTMTVPSAQLSRGILEAATWDTEAMTKGLWFGSLEDEEYRY